MDRFEEKAREIGKYFDWDDNSEQVNIVAQALREEGKIEWPDSEEIAAKKVEILNKTNGVVINVIFDECIAWLKERLR